MGRRNSCPYFSFLCSYSPSARSSFTRSTFVPARSGRPPTVTPSCLSTSKGTGRNAGPSSSSLHDSDVRLSLRRQPSPSSTYTIRLSPRRSANTSCHSPSLTPRPSTQATRLVMLWTQIVAHGTPSRSCQVEGGSMSR